MGQLLDYFDAHDLWRDTALIVTTDHGFLLGEHDFWAKNRMNMYEEIVRIPLFVHDPRRPRSAGARRSALTQTIDLAPTFLDLFGVPAAAEMQGHSLVPLRSADRSVRPGALFGYFGGAINVTDGRYTYHRFPPNPRSQELYQYTLMPTHIWEPFTPEELAQASLADPLPFTKGARVLKIPVTERSPMFDNYGPGALLENETRLYDLANDPGQMTPLSSPDVEAAMTLLMHDLMRANDAPPEAYARIAI
jgi:arylsulfatase A-like enzyme